MVNENDLSVLFWQLFDALGYVAGEDVPGAGVVLHRLIDPEGVDYAFGSDAGLMEFIVSKVPDWSRDAGAAAALCNQIARDNNWAVMTVDISADFHRAAFLRLENEGVSVAGVHFLHTCVEYSEYGATSAEALTRLALTVTCGEGAG